VTLPLSSRDSNTKLAIAQFQHLASLVVIKRMIEALGGAVSFESQEGKGTTFMVRLPQKS